MIGSDGCCVLLFSARLLSAVDSSEENFGAQSSIDQLLLLQLLVVFGGLKLIEILGELRVHRGRGAAAVVVR